MQKFGVDADFDMTRFGLPIDLNTYGSGAIIEVLVVEAQGTLL
jgi:hypothetical protein